MTFRARFTWQASALVAVLLTGFGFGVAQFAVWQAERRVDEELRDRLRPRDPGGPPPPVGPDGRGPRDVGPRGLGWRGERRFGDSGPGAPREFSDPLSTVRDPAFFFLVPRRIGPDGLSRGAARMAAISPAGLNRARERGEAFTTERIEGVPYRVLSLRPPDFPESDVLQVARDVQDLEAFRAILAASLMTAVGAAVALAAVSAAWLAARALAPVRAMGDAAAQISADDASARLPVKGNDEFARLGQQFNHLLDRITAALERQRRFTADASHELRTPLTRIRLLASDADRDRASADELRASLRETGRAAEGLHRMVEDLLTLARADQLAGATVTSDARDAIRGAIDALPGSVMDRLRVEMPAEPISVPLDAASLARAIRNLIENALKYSPPEAPVQIGMTRLREGVSITVADVGPGVPEAELARLTERFSRVDTARSFGSGGFGLGLSIVDAIVRSGNGQVHFRNRTPRGFEVEILLPNPREILTTAP